MALRKNGKGLSRRGGGGEGYRNLTVNEAGVRRVRKSVKFCDATKIHPPDPRPAPDDR